MKNVFYLDMNKFKAKGSNGSFFIYKRDYLIIKEILLRSVSQNLQDIIIGKWLNGTIMDNDYEDIIELSGRLFYTINQVKEVDSNLKERWITALTIALRTDLAYTMLEVEFILHEIFSHSLSFKIDAEYAFQTSEEADFAVCHSYFSNSIFNLLNANGKKAQDTIFKILYLYLEHNDFNKLTDNTSFPPIELLQFKSVCELLYKYESFGFDFPNRDKIDEFTKYFISIDSDYTKRLKSRKEQDRKRYQRKKRQ